MVSLWVAPLLQLSKADFGVFSHLFLVFAFAISMLINHVDNKKGYNVLLITQALVSFFVQCFQKFPQSH